MSVDHYDNTSTVILSRGIIVLSILFKGRPCGKRGYSLLAEDRVGMVIIAAEINCQRQILTWYTRGPPF